MINRIRAAGAAAVLAAGLGASMLAPAAQAATASHHPHPTQILVQHQGKRVSCGQYYVCNWQFANYTGALDEVQTPLNTWFTIPSGYRGAVRNDTTTKNVWIYSLEQHLWACAADSGGGYPNSNDYGREYIDTGDSCATSNRPNPPTG